MTHYLLSIYQPDGSRPADDMLATIMHDVHALEDEMRAASAWVFSGGLHPADSARVARPPREADEEMPMTDGPYVESKEHIGGVIIIDAATVDDARAWGRKLARATTLPIEIRRFHGDRG